MRGGFGEHVRRGRVEEGGREEGEKRERHVRHSLIPNTRKDEMSLGK